MLVSIAKFSSAGEPEDSLDDLGRIRSEINVLLEENKALESEYEAVRSEFFELQKEAAPYAEAITAKEQGLNVSDQRFLEELSVGNEPGEVNGEGARDLGQLQLSDAQYREEELKLELQLKERAHQKEKQRQEEEIIALEAKLSESREKEKNLSHRSPRGEASHLEETAANQSQRSQLLDDIKRVEAQNQLLRNKIFALRH